MLLLLFAFLAMPAQAVIPPNQTVPFLGAPGNFNSAVRISNVQGGRGTATLFMSKLDPENAAKNRNYMDLCFVTADHVMRLKGGGGPSDDDDTLPYPSNDNYGGAGPLAMQPGPADIFGSIGIGSTNDPNRFTLSAGAGVVASKVVLGEGIAKLNNKPTDIAFVGVTVDLDALTAVQKAILGAMVLVPLGGPPVDPAMAGGMPFDFAVLGGYGVTGQLNALPNEYVYIQGAPAHAYGRERFFDNTVSQYRELANGVYDYDSMKWTNGGQSMTTVAPGMGMQGDSGSAIIYNDTIIGVLTAGRMDKVIGMDGAVGYLLKNGYEEYAARMVPVALANLTTLCATYTYASATVPEPAGVLMAVAGVTMMLHHRRRRFGSRSNA